MCKIPINIKRQMSRDKLKYSDPGKLDPDFRRGYKSNQKNMFGSCLYNIVYGGKRQINVLTKKNSRTSDSRKTRHHDGWIHVPQATLHNQYIYIVEPLQC